MSKATELISLHKDKSDDPRFAVCYARGSVFKLEGHFHRVERGKRSLVSRALCLAEHFGNRCAICPNRNFKATFVARALDEAGS
jgi:hypothetical protein